MQPRPGFADPVHDAQATFRGVLDAVSHPGRIVSLPLDLPPLEPFAPAALAVCLALADSDTPLWLDPPLRRPEIAAHLRFHAGCPLVVDAAAAAFAVVADAAAMPPLDAFALGREDYPDRSATVIVQVPALQGGRAVVAAGAGIADRGVFAPAGLPADFWDWAAANQALFPCGVDVLFACGRDIVALPRSTRLEV